MADNSRISQRARRQSLDHEVLSDKYYRTRLSQLLWDLVEKDYAQSEKEEGRQFEVFHFQEIV